MSEVTHENQPDIPVELALGEVTAQYIKFINTAGYIHPEEMADFLVVAAKLLLIKSRTLLDNLAPEEDEELEELERQLKMYKEFIEASKAIGKMAAGKRFTYSRKVAVKSLDPTFSPPKGLVKEQLLEVMRIVLQKLEVVQKLPKKLIDRTITIGEKISKIKSLISEKIEFGFYELIGNKANKTEKIVGFLALLELVKMRIINISQGDRFGDITVHRLGDDDESMIQ